MCLVHDNIMKCNNQFSNNGFNQFFLQNIVCNLDINSVHVKLNEFMWFLDIK